MSDKYFTLQSQKPMILQHSIHNSCCNVLQTPHTFKKTSYTAMFDKHPRRQCRNSTSQCNVKRTLRTSIPNKPCTHYGV